METGETLAAARREYTRAGLSEEDLTASPLELFDRWYAEAAALLEPNAMVVATTSADGQPSARMVLLKGVSDEGFVFFTNLASRKGEDLAANPRAALLFPWHPLERQVRIEGTVETLTDAEVAAYFATRPRSSQLGAWASHQSRPVTGRDELEAAYREAEDMFGGAEVTVPPEWGGYRVRPETIEFWQGRSSRMHDRLVYVREGDGWRTLRLAP
ncbi:pyridoxine/pyridoxamine 5'-phosphate oxidase [Nocardioides baekrokdamisoli]|uniref:Pyridoxine/pyridoxamine 5'-phosphate oxidase n=1 Tax=Nocardioides baekrokdamisoli TaxID=1804624 RepID=A0A3G9IZY5_9ACTN|nr:pyridoxamine 5'-phosphate oxidase [Nocardioides baekrokdamisoli]BBH16938.1 pyridoxine/pyridoxamine 5'-phosphate oxidase [Nocardioides baekrokdamisoli]